MSINLQALIEIAERSIQIHNSLIPKDQLEHMSRVAHDIQKTLGPMNRLIQSEAFQFQLKEFDRASKRLSTILEDSHVLNLPAIQAMNDLYGTADKVSESIAPTQDVPETKRAELITRQIYSEAKIKIRSGIPSIKEILPLSLPANTAWENVQARFVDPHTLFIEIPKHKVKITVDYKDMGMWDMRSGLPNAQWTVLRGIAQYGGITWKTPVANLGVKKQKQLLSTALKRYFNFEDDPFMVYRKEKAYRLKMVLIPDNDSPLVVDEFEDDTLGVKEYLDENSPQKYDQREYRSTFLDE